MRRSPKNCGGIVEGSRAAVRNSNCRQYRRAWRNRCFVRQFLRLRWPMKMNGVKVAPAPDGKTLVATFAKPLSAGTYKVDYHIVSTDTHRVQGSYTFKVK